LRLRSTSSTNWYFSQNQMWICLQQQRLFQWLKFRTKFDQMSYNEVTRVCLRYSIIFEKTKSMCFYSCCGRVSPHDDGTCS
jgi:hypothetical protein